MRNILRFSALTLICIACQSGQEYKTFRTEVLTYHDQVMVDSEKAISRKMKLDKISRQMDSLFSKKIVPDTVKEKQQIGQLIGKLNSVDEQMIDWMHDFKADIDGKSNEEASVYFKAEKQKIIVLDSLYKAVLSESDAYLLKYK